MQAIKLATDPECNDIDLVFSSDLSRALQTAELMFHGRAIITSQLLRERTFGEFDGKTASELRQLEEYSGYFTDPGLKDFRYSFSQRAPGGENLSDVVIRAEKFFTELFTECQNKTVAIVSHSSFLRCSLHYLLKLKEEETQRIKLPNAKPVIALRDRQSVSLVNCSLLDISR